MPYSGPVAIANEETSWEQPFCGRSNARTEAIPFMYSLYNMSDLTEMGNALAENEAEALHQIQDYRSMREHCRAVVG